MSNEAQAYTADELAIKQDDADNRVTNRDLRWLATLAERDAKHAAEMAEVRARVDLAPPWVLFSDKGKAVAILPAMRPGEVADVRGLSMHEARELVRLANELHGHLVMAKLERLASLLKVTP